MSNKQRASKIRRIFSEHYEHAPVDMGRKWAQEVRTSNLTDILADLRHFADSKGLDFANCDRIAYGHYLHERQLSKVTE